MHKVTVILTSYNHSKYIREAIDSTLNQTFRDFELIILDDCSSDDSWEVISSYADPRIRAFRNAVNMGGAVEINRVISEAASTAYIAMHHSDDIWELDKLEKEVALLDAHPEIGAVFSNALAIGEDSSPLIDRQHFYSDVFNQPNRSRHEWLRHFFFRGNALCHPSALVRKACYDNCGVYPYTLAQLGDFDMWVRLCLKYEIHVLPDRLVRFRVRDNEANTSGNRPDVRIRDRSEFQHVLKRYFGIDDFEELASIFPEAKKYRRAESAVPRFVMAMVTLFAAESLPWAKALAIHALFDLLDDAAMRERIAAVYQFNYRDLIALTGKHDLFFLETVANQTAEIVRRDAVISRQTEHIAELMRSPGITARRDSMQAVGNREQPADREAYGMAVQLFESGRAGEGKALLEELVRKGSTCWDVYNDLGVQYFNEGDFLRATACFEQGLALEGEAGTTARNYASMRLAAGDIEGALATWGGILREQPQDDATLTVIRDVLSNVNPIPSAVWDRLVADLRSGTTEGAVSHGFIDEAASRVSAAQVNEIKIFQIYYDENTKSQLDPDFIPLDNLENPRPDWCEYWSIRKVLLNQTFDDNTYLGFFSPRFYEKTGLHGWQVIDIVRNSSEEVISFSPYFDQSALNPNPFFQGEYNHPGLIRITQDILAILGVNLDLNALVSDRTTTIFSNYFVARYSFWKKWLSYAEKVFAISEGADCELKRSLVAVTQHRHTFNYAMKVFIIERLVTILMEEQRISAKMGIDVRQAPLTFVRSRQLLDKLIVCDELKSQYRKTGLMPFLEVYGLFMKHLLLSDYALFPEDFRPQEGSAN